MLAWDSAMACSVALLELRAAQKSSSRFIMLSMITCAGVIQIMVQIMAWRDHLRGACGARTPSPRPSETLPSGRRSKASQGGRTMVGPSVRRSVGRSVGPSVRRSVGHSWGIRCDSVPCVSDCRLRKHRNHGPKLRPRRPSFDGAERIPFGRPTEDF